jgi:uncharacterized protein (TIGR02246 family)
VYRIAMFVGVCACAAAPRRVAATAGSAEIAAFNDAMTAATRRMDDAAIVALWEDDGVSLLPGAMPLVGKPAIAAFIAETGRAHPGAKMLSFEMKCAGIEIVGDAASEYCFEHQLVELAPDKPRFEGSGNLILVLHRGADGKWRLRREMWNAGPESRQASP